MKIEVARGLLHDALGKIAIALENKDELEAYTLLALTVVDGKLTLSAANQKMSAQACIDTTSSDGNAAFCVSGNLLKNIIAAMPLGQLQFLGPAGGQSIVVEGRSASFRLNQVSIDRFPPLAVDYARVAFDSVNYVELLSALKKVEFSSGEGDQVKDVFKGVFVDKDNFTATDGRRISIFPNRVLRVTEPFIIPNASVSRLLKLYKGMGEQGGFYGTPEGLHFVNSSVFATSRTLSGVFPNYRQAIPGGPCMEVVLERAPLLSALKRMLLVVDKKGNPLVDFQFGNGVLRVSSASSTASAREEIDCDFDSTFEVTLNGRYVVEVLDRMDAAAACMQLRPPRRYPTGEEMPTAVVITEGAYTNVILPVKR